MIQYVIVLDYSIGGIYIYTADISEVEEQEKAEGFIQDKGHKFSNCHYMIVDELNLHINE